MKRWPTAPRTCAAVCALVLVVTSCSSSTGPTPCSAELAGGSCLVFEDAGALGAHRAAIESVVADALVRVEARMPVGPVTLRVRADASGAIPELGIGGYNPGPHEVILSVDAAFATLDASIRDDLGPMVAHELHHARRRRSVGYGSTLLEAMISEGLADHFAIEIFGTDAPPWAVALDPAATDSMRALAETQWSTGPYDHARWFYGTDSSIPRWTGYTVGFELVATYLDADPSRRASGLYAEPAARFAP